MINDAEHDEVEKRVNLFPPNFRNELFDQNMAYFQEKQPQLFDSVNNHECQTYRLCSNSDGSPNIVDMESRQLLYADSTQDELLSSIHENIDRMRCQLDLNPAYFGEAPEDWNINNPIQFRMLNRLYDIGVFKELGLSINTFDSLADFCSDYLPMVRVYGIGFGFHLSELILRKKISYMLVFEPHFDLFYISLYTLPWYSIFHYFEGNNKGIHLEIGTASEQAIKSQHSFMRQRMTSASKFFYRFSYYGSSSPVIQEMIQQEPMADAAYSQEVDAGWYEDQRNGFYLSARNIKAGSDFFNGKKVKRCFRAFIIGSGPSLDDSISYLQAHRDDAIIIACGTALAPLVAAGIIPDYEVVQERDWYISGIEQSLDANILKKITLCKLNVVSARTDHYYKNVLVFQKARDPGSILMDPAYPVIEAVNPTVTNAGISMAAELGVDEVYLFGVDYGAPVCSPRLHAKNTLYDDLDDDVVENESFMLPGNLGAVVRSDGIFSWSHKVTEFRINRHPDIQWFNVGEGALIQGAMPLAVADLPKRFSRKIQKPRLRKAIASCFDNHYSFEVVMERLKTSYMGQVNDYFIAMQGFMNARPQSREEVMSILSLMYQAVSVGYDQQQFLPASLLSQGLKQFIINVYIQNGLYQGEVAAAAFFANAQVILAEHINDIRNDLNRITIAMESDVEIDLWKEVKNSND